MPMVGWNPEGRVGLILLAVSAIATLVVALLTLPDLDQRLKLALLVGYLAVAAFAVLLGSGLYERYKVRNRSRKWQHRIRKHPSLLQFLRLLPEQIRWFFEGPLMLRTLYLERVRDRLDSPTATGLGNAFEELFATLGESWRNIEDEIRQFSQTPNPNTSWFLNIVGHVERLGQGLRRLFLAFQNLAEKAMAEMDLDEENRLVGRYEELRERFGEFRSSYRQFLMDLNQSMNASKNLETVPTLPQLRRPARYE